MLGGRDAEALLVGELAAATVDFGRLLDPEDLFELAHWERLDRAELRVGCRQLQILERRLGPADVRPFRAVAEPPETHAEIRDETFYPAGGIASLTNRGSLENLVASELVHLDASPGVGLFEVRWLEGELLYYARDAGRLRRKRRVVHLVLDLDERFLGKGRGHDVQPVILAQALLLRLGRDVARIFETDAVKLHFHFLYGNLPRGRVAEEMEVAELLLRDETKHGHVSFSLEPDLDLATLPDATRKTYVVATSAHRAEALRTAVDALPRTGAGALHGAIVDAGLGGSGDDPGLRLAFEGMPFAEVVRLRERVLARLVGAPG